MAIVTHENIGLHRRFGAEKCSVITQGWETWELH